MKYLVLLSLAIAVCAASVIKDPTKGYEEGDRYFYFPGDDDTLYLVDTLEPSDDEFISQLSRNSDSYGIWLYTRSNPTVQQILRVDDVDSILNSNFDFSKVTVVSVHGWNGDGTNKNNRLLTEAFLSKDDVNVIVLDWGVLAKRNYITARNGVPALGRTLGQFLNWLVSLGASYERMHLVGFSLGAHLVGNAGREMGGRVKRITALDPAGPLWDNSNRIAKSDAQYVEVVHTNGALFGWMDLLGDSDFYPNGGERQPGCFFDSCSHSMAYKLMASSVTNNHLFGNLCNSLRDARRGRCSGELAEMGNDDLNKKVYGIYHLKTDKDYPY